MYKFLKLILGFLLYQFFSEIKIRGKEKREEGPVLIVVNHPNLALDSLLIATSFKRDLWFIAKATLFSNSLLNKFFTACHMLPVQRKQDSADGQIDNRQTFAKVVDKLCSKQGVVIFPEGVSLGERKIHPLKSGAARMAFEAEESAGFNLDLKIQAAGITYSKLDAFKSSVTVTFAEPISVAVYKSDYERDAQNAVRKLTEQISEELTKVTVNIENEKHIELVEKISALYRSREKSVNDTELMQIIAKNVSKHSEQELSNKKDLIERIDIYSELASLFAMDGTFTLDQNLNKFLMFLALPFAFLAYVLNIIPYRIVGNKTRNTLTHPVYTASAKFGYGILLFSSWYLLISMIVSLWTNSLLNFFVTLIFCLLSGYLLNRFVNHINLFIISNFWPVNKKPLDLLLLIRNDLIAELDSLRTE